MKYLPWFLFLIPLATFAADYEKNLQDLSRERIVFQTSMGDIAVALYPNAAPNHVKQILRLAEAKVFDGIPIFRIEKGFVAQISNFDRRPMPLNGEQSALVHKLNAEFNSIHHRRGILSMARFDDPNSAETSFSFMLGEASHLDNKYTVFGEIVAGMDVLAAIENLEVDKSSSPLRSISILGSKVFPDGNFGAYQLRSVQPEPADPDAPYQTFFAIFAALAFGITILLPIAKTWWAAMAKK